MGRDGWLYDPTVEEQEPGLADRITDVKIWSDGAGQHHKQCGTLHAASVFLYSRGSWSFSAPGHGKQKVDGFGGVVKNRTANYLRATNKHIGNAHELYEVVHELFAGDAAVARYNADDSITIKAWTISYIDESTVQRPAARDPAGKKKAAQDIKAAEAEVNKVTTAINKAQTKLEKVAKEDTRNKLTEELTRLQANRDALVEKVEDLNAKAEEAAEASLEQEDAGRIGSIKAFHGSGVRGLFEFRFLHPGGLSVSINSCHCSFCARLDFRNGFWRPPFGCLQQEDTEYVVFERLDEEWMMGKLGHLMALADHLWNGLQAGDIVALGRSEMDDTSYYQFTGRPFDPKFPPAVFEAFTIVRVVRIVDQNAKQFEGVMYEQFEGSLTYCEDIGARFVFGYDQLRLNFGTTLESFNVLRYVYDDEEEDVAEAGETKEADYDCCVKLTNEQVREIIMAVYLGDNVT